MKVLYNEDDKMLFIQRCKGSFSNVVIANLGKSEIDFVFPFEGKKYRKIIDSADSKWGGSGVLLRDEIKNGEKVNINGLNFAVFER
jgi:maltooligosyltrehalose trehalohydrolase